MAKWTHVNRITCEIELLDGTRIGGAGGGMEIGGVDPNLMALRDPVTGFPYLPGSSLKGKLRSTLEKMHDLSPDGKPCGCGRSQCPVCSIFGAHMNTRSGTPRLIVRDAKLTESCRALWEERARQGLPLFENKTENTIDRVRGQAINPRTQERVPPGAEFAAELILKVFEGDDDTKMLANLKNALAVVENFDALGAGGSRGSGRIRIKNFRADKVALASVSL